MAHRGYAQGRLRRVQPPRRSEPLPGAGARRHAPKLPAPRLVRALEDLGRVRKQHLLWRIWLGLVALPAIGSLVWTLLLAFVWHLSTTIHRSFGVRATTATTYPAESSRPAMSWSNARSAPDAGEGVVRVNRRSDIYHFPGYRWYGTTVQGKYTSEQDAVAEDDRAALNERRPANFGSRELR